MKTYTAKIWRVSIRGLPGRAIEIKICAIIPFFGHILPIMGFSNRKKKQGRATSLPAVVPGFEPGQTEPKPVVLPLHHTTIAYALKGLAKILKAGYSAMSR